MLILQPQDAPLLEFNRMHDRMGRFSSGGGGGASHSAPDTGSGSGGVAGRTTHGESALAHDAAAKANAHAAKHPDDAGARRDAIKATDRALAHTQMTPHTPQVGHEAANSAYHLTRSSDAAAGHASAATNHDAAAASHRAAGNVTVSAKKAKAAAGPVMHNGVELTQAHLTSLDAGGLARIASQDWRKQGKGVNYAAKPYLDALHTMSSVHDSYGQDSGGSVARYFLGNATSWKGPVAKAVKAELNKRLKGK